MIVRILTAIVLMLSLCGPLGAEDVALKLPNVAGGFYTDDPIALSRQIDEFISLANVPEVHHNVQVAIAPHAGYIYSGSIAAHTFKAIAQNQYSIIIILAPSHYYPFDGASIWPKGAFKTPLGVVPVDQDFAKALLNETPVVKELPEVFNQEHALEVELPFVQKIFPKAKIVPLLLGQPDFKNCEQLAVALNKLIGNREDILVLVSSDMSHYHPYDNANKEDAGTLEAIRHEDVEAFWNGNISRTMEMCGFVPVTVGMMVAKLRGLSSAQVLKYANSGDTAGDKAKVVGYGAVIFYKSEQSVLNVEEKKYLLKMARETMETFVKTGKKLDIKNKFVRLDQVQGAFVTLIKNGQLRGCIGNIIGQQALVLTVRDMAIAAASEDPRFSPVTLDELKDIHVEISVLSLPGRIKDLDQIVLGRDGVIVSDGADHQGVFLPQVATETGWDKDRFLSELCNQKAGLSSDCWKDAHNSLYTFTADVFSEK